MVLPERSLVCVALVFCLAVTSLVGCSSVFYYPDQALHTQPDKFPIKPQDVWFSTEDGARLNAWLFRTPKRPAKGMIVFFHGNGQNLSSHFYSLYWILPYGWDYLVFDYRGYGRSPGKPSPEGTVLDGRAAFAFAHSLRDPKSPGKLVIFGQSLGGAVALKVACDAVREMQSNGSEKQPDFDQIAVESTFHSYGAVARKVASGSWILWPFQWMSYPIFSDAWAPKGCIHEISPRPLLVIHGTSDGSVDFSLGERVFAEARDPKQFWRIEKGGHIDAFFRDGGRHRIDFLNWLEDPSRKAVGPSKSTLRD